MINIDRLLNITLEEFLEKYLKANKPCIFDKSFTASWSCRNEWADVLKLFKNIDLNNEMIVADCKTNYFNSHVKTNMKLCDFLSYWKNSEKDERILYLKDWHYFLPNNKNNNNIEPEIFFDLPIYFSSDWLNEFWTVRNDIKDDFKFVYVGVKGSWTGLHVDVCLSYSWSANISGEKRWWLFPPGDEALLDSPAGDIRCDSKLSDVPHIDVVQREGEIIFVPSGWHHQVVNISDCVSINHNWINGCSVLQCWKYLSDKIVEVKIATEDVKDTPGYEEECQICLKAYCGLNFQEFTTMVEFILFKRIYKLFYGDKWYYRWTSSIEGYTECTKKLQYRIEELLIDINIHSLRLDNCCYLNDLEINDIVRAVEVLHVIINDPVSVKLNLMKENITQFISETYRSLKLYL